MKHVEHDLFTVFQCYWMGGEGGGWGYQHK